eukprot:jgi/Orpsp1_1/1188782/evm.model.d7180000067137.1
MVYRCSEYKTPRKCNSLIVLNDNNEILRYESNHNHLERECDVALSIMKYNINNEVKKNKIPFDLKVKHLYEKFSHEMGLICPELGSIKSQAYRKINKQLPPDISSYDEVPNESEYYKIKRENKYEDFMIFKDPNLIIFQSPFQAELFAQYNEDVFADGTFRIAPKFSYQVFITRTYVSKYNKYYTTSFSILNNKEQSTYEVLFNVLKNNASKICKNYVFPPKNFHCDFEIAISNAARKVFPNINIKYCVWHYKRSLEAQKNKSCSDEVENNDNIYTYYKNISNLPFINPKYVFDIYIKIKRECQKKEYKNFLEFLNYFYDTYLMRYDVNSWNYYENIEHITNNA